MMPDGTHPRETYKVAPIALVLAPTRELAVQINDEATKVLKGSKASRNHRHGIWACCVYGGGRRGDQVRNLSWGSHIVVATPGRLVDFVTSRVLSLERVTYFVLDEADRMLDLGFSGDVNGLSGQIRPERQVLFFSATWSAAVQDLARGLCHKGARLVRISVGQGGHCAKNTGARLARESIAQEIIVVDHPDDYERQSREKQKILDEHVEAVLSESDDNKVLVFVSQKTYADELANKLWDVGFKAAAMHGGKSQDSRLWTLDQFRKGDLRLLVATDVIGRGIDIPSVSHVVVFEMGTTLPPECEEPRIPKGSSHVSTRARLRRSTHLGSPECRKTHRPKQRPLGSFLESGPSSPLRSPTHAADARSTQEERTLRTSSPLRGDSAGEP